MNNNINLIAELCQNHNGDISILKEMVWAAAENGATHVKTQNIFAEDLSKRDRFENGVINSNNEIEVIKRPYQEEYDRLKKLELSYEDQLLFIEECKKANVEPLTTLFNIDRIADIKALGFKSIKVASYDCGSFPLIEALSTNFQEVIVSTGASYNNEIEESINILKKSKVKFSILHCVTIYPTNLNQFHLSRMEFLYSLSNSVGFSDHSLAARDDIKGSLCAIYLGATTIERHFTILASDQTRDGPVSINKKQLNKLKNFSNLSKENQLSYLNELGINIKELQGDKDRVLSKEELLNRDYYRGRFINKIDNNIVYNWEDSARELLNYKG
jgi:N,N'-diacetyllegionaminate synthase